MEIYIMGFNYNNNIINNNKVLKAKLENKIIYATDRICTYGYDDVSTTTGFLNTQETIITCTMHSSTFNLKNRIPQNSI
jgi:nitrite reductase/ring-hydroxylating ferredoxin subunit